MQMEQEHGTTPRSPWWKETVIYQIYPRSFKDSGSDGIGDLEGIISRLDYLAGLGVETLWLSPFYPSPQRDVGYDIADYRGVDPAYGSMETFERLLSAVHERGMKLIMDMVLNHTSDEHPWFVESASSRDSAKRDWYVWRDGQKPDGKAPPNNWKSMVAGSGWHYHPPTGQWYWASFLPFQPDLNYRNPEVKEAIFDMLRFWLEKGVDGFRLDIIGAVFEDPDFRDNPLRFKVLPDEEHDGAFFRSTEMTQNHPDNFAFARELRELTDRYDDPPRVLLGETFGPPRMVRNYCGSERADGLHLAFLFKGMQVPFRARALRDLIEEYEHWFPEPFIPTWVFSNHDRYRRYSVLGEHPGRARLNAALQLTARGVPCIYYGEEIGMRQGRIPLRMTRDGATRHLRRFPAPLLKLGNRLTGGAVQRDGCRTPMQWSGEPQAGFTAPDAEPWLPVNDDYPQVNAARQEEDEHSLLACYRRFLAFRRTSAALRRGSLTLLSKQGLPEGVLGYLRREGQETLLVLLNVTSRQQRVTVPAEELPEEVREGGPVLQAECSTHLAAEQRRMTGELLLLPWEGTVWSVSGV
jgi:oligo-1,6-glucosidase/alpha-glucosidase